MRPRVSCSCHGSSVVCQCRVFCLAQYIFMMASVFAGCCICSGTCVSASRREGKRKQIKLDFLAVELKLLVTCVYSFQEHKTQLQSCSLAIHVAGFYSNIKLQKTKNAALCQLTGHLLLIGILIWGTQPMSKVWILFVY